MRVSMAVKRAILAMYVLHDEQIVFMSDTYTYVAAECLISMMHCLLSCLGHRYSLFSDLLLILQGPNASRLPVVRGVSQE